MNNSQLNCSLLTTHKKTVVVGSHFSHSLQHCKLFDQQFFNCSNYIFAFSIARKTQSELNERLIDNSIQKMIQMRSLWFFYSSSHRRRRFFNLFTTPSNINYIDCLQLSIKINSIESPLIDSMSAN
jgi:hypothetical protein